MLASFFIGVSNFSIFASKLYRMNISLSNIHLINFKSYNELELVMGPKINCFVGSNGSGKTNLLDAIHYLSLCKSYFTASDTLNIKHGEDFFILQGDFDFDGTLEAISCGFKSGQKKILKRNKKSYDRLSDHIGLIPLIIVSPSDIELIYGGSEERRKFIDGAISQFDKNYLESLIKYNKALNQRNSLLKEFGRSGSSDMDMLEVWDNQLCLYGESIFIKRKTFIEELTHLFLNFYRHISNDVEQVELIYDSQLGKGELGQLLKQSVKKDMVLEYTSVGIHKDDLVFMQDGFPMKRVGSQGQQKTLLVSLKLAELSLMKEKTGKVPILLLDDIFDKFDAIRVMQLIKLVSGQTFGQIFITDTDRNNISQLMTEVNSDFKIFEIIQNQIREVV
jgi:DNA replication and repair protein RecF